MTGKKSKEKALKSEEEISGLYVFGASLIEQVSKEVFASFSRFI
jgi:hypothetical protein